MNTPNNRRKRESRQRIEQVFIELLQERELNQISVSDICKRAQLNRSTFYANYADVYALADTIRDRLEKNHDGLFTEEISSSTYKDYFPQLFCHIRDNQTMYRTYFKLGYDMKYEIKGFDRTMAMRLFDNRMTDYHMEFFRAGITRIIKIWLEGGCRETPEEMVGVIHSEYRSRQEFFQEDGTLKV